MKPVEQVQGVAAVLWRDHIDTDVIIPSRDIASPSREGFGTKLFAPWRYEGPGGPERPDFVLNRAPWRQARILIAGHNFGCGSSREMAVWALQQFGIGAVLAPSFGAIFRQNAVRNGLLPVALPAQVLLPFVEACTREPLQLTVDLRSGTVSGPSGEADGLQARFDFDAEDREMLLSGLDAIERTLQQRAAIEAFEAGDRQRRPWIWISLDIPGGMEPKR